MLIAMMTAYYTVKKNFREIYVDCRHDKTKTVYFCINFTGIAWLAGFVLFHHRINHFAPDDGQPADAIVVLTGGKNRIAEAVKLLNDGLGEKLFISGVSKGISLNDLSQRTDITIRTQREITLDDRSTNTIENAIEAAEWIEKIIFPPSGW